MIYRFRVILDTHEDVFRDLEINAEDTLEDLHNVIVQSFGFGGQEMASFYLSDPEWLQGEEIPMFDMSEVPGEIKVMNETFLEDVVNEQSPRLIYVYDFLNMWTFLVELAEIAEIEEGRTYPNLIFAHGHIPEEAPEKEFIAEPESGSQDALDRDYDTDEFQDLDFDENWN